MNALLHATSILDQHGPRRAAATEPRPRDGIAQEGSSPTAGLGTVEAGLLETQQRARIYQFERVIDRLHDLMTAERFDDAYTLVHAEYLAIHGPR